MGNDPQGPLCPGSPALSAGAALVRADGGVNAPSVSGSRKSASQEGGCSAASPPGVALTLQTGPTVTTQRVLRPCRPPARSCAASTRGPGERERFSPCPHDLHVVPPPTTCKYVT